MEPDALVLARLQFAFTIAVHIVFPAFSRPARRSACGERAVCRRSARLVHAAKARAFAKPLLVALAVFISLVAVFSLAFVGLAVSAYPYLVPWELTLWDTAGALESQTFILIGVAILLPFIIGYTVFVYYTFRGKLREGEGYH